MANESADVGYLRVETDTDERVDGSLSYGNVRRPFDLYSPDGKIIRADITTRVGEWVRNLFRLTYRQAGRWYGTVYRKVQVEVRAGTTTDVPASALRKAPRVFPN
jgi:hypothetical protein